MPGPSPFQTVVVGVDGDAGGRAALAFAARLQRTFASHVVAVLSHSVDGIPSRASSPAYEAAMRDEARRTLARELARAAVVAEPDVVSSLSPQRALHEAARERGAQLIIVGAGRHSGLARMMGSDVTAATLHGAPCPVAVARDGAATISPRLRTIAVGFDGSPQSRAALDLARDLASAAGARLQLLWVVPSPIPLDSWTDRAVAISERDRAERDRAREQMAEIVAAYGPDVVGETAPGIAHEELAQLCYEADLLVVGSRGEGAMRRLLRGSTSTRLAREAPCPVLLVPPSSAPRDLTTRQAPDATRRAA
jgi:nucleotide-binding universal stress UspA family protein